ncbi:MAG: nickel pincer cofactor biosynthesis protein LarC [bacterium]|nr:nickel pincer cofactor biosynthesis protein LarC [bacterium]
MKPDARRVLFLDAGAGAAGDMILGALIDAGAPLARVKRELAGLDLPAWSLTCRKTLRCGISGRDARVRVRGDDTARDYRTIRKIVRGGGLAADVRERALAVFERLIRAEAEVHGVPVERAHLHEVGAVDAIVDIVGTSIALSILAPRHIVVSPMTTGHGSVRCQHGTYPVPAPATLLLVRGFPTVAGEHAFERLTPTGAAILTTIADAWGPMPALLPRAIGYGAGDRDVPGVPNMLRAVVGDAPGEAGSDVERRVVVIEFTVDDATPQLLAYVAERLREAGALDVFVTPVLMKKGRPGHNVTLVSRPDDSGRLAGIALEETPTLGVRMRDERRIELQREIVKVRTRYGHVRVKLGHRDGRRIQAWPEFDDCAAAARKHSVPLAEVQQAALSALARDR